MKAKASGLATVFLAVSSILLSVARGLESVEADLQGQLLAWLGLVALAGGLAALSVAGVRWAASRISSTRGYRLGLRMDDGVVAPGPDEARRWRYAGPHDLREMSELGRNVLGVDSFYSEDELAAYLAAQRDSIWRFEVGKGDKWKLSGYAIILALRPLTVERIKSGRIVSGRHILPSDLESDLDRTDAVYLAMLHDLDRRALHTVSNTMVRRILESDRRRRPQLVLGREGTPLGRRWMDAHGFGLFGEAPSIEATFSDRTEFRAAAHMRGVLSEVFGDGSPELEFTTPPDSDAGPSS